MVLNEKIYNSTSPSPLIPSVPPNSIISADNFCLICLYYPCSFGVGLLYCLQLKKFNGEKQKTPDTRGMSSLGGLHSNDRVALGAHVTGLLCVIFYVKCGVFTHFT